MSTPPEKKARTEEEPKKTEPEVAQELEQDAAPVKGAQFQGPVGFNVKDTTMNLLPSTRHNILKSLGEGGVQHLLAGARANAGMKAGRYMFEVKAIEFTDNRHSQGRHGSVLRVGVSTAEASLILGEDSESVCFESDGSFLHAKQKKKVAQHFNAGLVYSVLVNLDKSSPNCNTISLFREGVRVTPPQPLPEALQNKPLFPAVTFKHATVHTHFGPEALCPLPFVCRMLGGADKADVVAAANPEAPKDGKYDVIYPVGLPSEGAFDWLDMFLQKNPHYTEISDRAIVAWAKQSGYVGKGGVKGSNDKPEMSFGLKELEDGSVRRTLMKIAPLQQRHFVVMELRGNLVKQERDAILDRFPSAMFKKTAYVLVGEPTADFKKHTLELVLSDKQKQADLAFRAKKAEERREKILANKVKEQEIAKKKAVLAKKKADLAKEKEAAAASAAKAEGEEKEGEAQEGEAKEEKPAVDFTEKEEEIKKEEEEIANEQPDEVMPAQDEEPPKVALDDEDKKVNFHVSPTPDMAQNIFNVSFAKFALPEKEEGFDDVKYIWSKAPQAAEYLKKYILSHKLTSRIEDTYPSKAFRAQLSKWQHEVKTWTTKQATYKSAVAKKEAEKRSKALKKEAEEKAAAAKKEAEAKSEDTEKKEEEPAKVEEEKKEDEEMPEAEVDFEGVDIFAVEDITDIGAGMPLFRDFLPEDWAMLTLRFELYLLCHAIRIDANDPDRTGIYLDHLSFYYQKYFSKQLIPKEFGADSCEDLIELVSDTLYLTNQKVLQTLIPEELEKYGIFVRLTEEARRHRALLIDSGAETARLKVGGTKVSGNSNKGGNSGHKPGQGYGGKGYEPVKPGGKWGGKRDGGKGNDKGGYGKWQSGGKASGPYGKAWGK
eukprot:TRINITY_DN411_c0_g2_i1.p1 TRINITY_DN411_c0_g2~~TRINITY_DN411_c0_g2_i1.p1  ORF type:complete len:906 (+),score=299.95 TRINITY_DN411_c0_g2_i1:70-2718(+)